MHGFVVPRQHVDVKYMGRTLTCQLDPRWRGPTVPGRTLPARSLRSSVGPPTGSDGVGRSEERTAPPTQVRGWLGSVAPTPYPPGPVAGARKGTGRRQRQLRPGGRRLTVLPNQRVSVCTSSLLRGATDHHTQEPFVSSRSADIDFTFTREVTVRTTADAPTTTGWSLEEPLGLSYVVNDNNDSYDWHSTTTDRAAEVLTLLDAPENTDYRVALCIYSTQAETGGQLLFFPRRTASSFIPTINRRNCPARTPSPTWAGTGLRIGPAIQPAGATESAEDMAACTAAHRVSSSPQPYARP